MWTRGLLYFVLLYGVGIALEGMRFYWAVPVLGDSLPELVEAGAFLAVAAVSARLLVRGEGNPLDRWSALVMGLFAAGLFVAQDFVLVAPLLDLGAVDYLRLRGRSTLVIYYAALAITSVLPLVFARPPDARPGASTLARSGG
jgi:hypothetical protein